MVSKISRADLRNRLEAARQGDTPIVLLEALPFKYYREKHLPGAVNMPHDAVDSLAPTLVPDKTSEIVVYCASATCKNSAIAAARLEALGYSRVQTYDEGKADWIAANLPIEAGTAAESRRRHNSLPMR
jgi:rhodanese-related sulfurtransferase